MPPRERLGRVRMQRVALVAPSEALRAVLVEVADAGVMEFDPAPRPAHAPAGPVARLLHLHGTAANGVIPALVRDPPDPELLAREGQVELLAGEAELEHHMTSTVRHGRVSGTVGWMPYAAIPELRARIEPLGGALVVLPAPVGVDPPTFLAPRGVSSHFRLLIDTYGTVCYADLDPTPFAAIAFAVMFGMMFGDVGHGLLLIALGLLARTGRGVLGRFRAGWALAVSAGVVAIGFGIAYGEMFGPTHVVPALWLVPLDDPVRLLVAGVALGTVLLAVSQVIGSVNRWREGGPAYALYAPSGIAGLCSYVGLGLLGAGLYEHARALTICGGLLVVTGVLLTFVGGVVAAGGRGSGAAQATVESVDGVVRLGSNVVSFARLAAFGLAHAAIGAVVWSGTTALWHPSVTAAAAVALFVVGNLAAFALEALVVGVQALRLEYYELFSHMFVDEGRSFEPWHVAITSANATKEKSWASG
jgi:V/A-type H+/Na+-transporting ATPase subunit I